MGEKYIGDAVDGRMASQETCPEMRELATSLKGCRRLIEFACRSAISFWPRRTHPPWRGNQYGLGFRRECLAAWRHLTIAALGDVCEQTSDWSRRQKKFRAIHRAGSKARRIPLGD